jgi:hypothetical protein
MGGKSINLRLDDDTTESLDKLTAAYGGLSQNQVINRAIVLVGKILGGANEQRSWRRGEASGLGQAASWCKARADFFENDPQGLPPEAIKELRWAALQFGKLASEASKQAEQIPPGVVS